jgi:hypothetical protein
MSASHEESSGLRTRREDPRVCPEFELPQRALDENPMFPGRPPFYDWRIVHRMRIAFSASAATPLHRSNP